jgi:cysteinyl-tRNA synthetase
MNGKIKLYDSRTSGFIELDEKNISMYNCGPTVYNHVHIGNVRPMLTFDILYRYMLNQGLKVNYLHNLTDIDDKIINKAAEEKCSEKEISEKYIAEYKKILERTNAIPMTMMPKVSDNIESIIGYVERLVKLDKAYVANNDVYFSIDTVKDTYGEISKQKIDMLLDGVRKENNSGKKNPLDFVL